MRRFYTTLFACAAMSLGACTGGSAGPASTGGTVAVAAGILDTYATRYRDLRAFVDLILPYLPVQRAAQIRAAGDRVDRALALLQAAASVATRRTAEQDVRRALADFALISGN